MAVISNGASHFETDGMDLAYLDIKCSQKHVAWIFPSASSLVHAEGENGSMEGSKRLPYSKRRVLPSANQSGT